MIYKTYTEAYAAAKKLRQQHIANGVMVRIEKSPYGGYQTKLVPIDLMIDDLSSNLPDGRPRKSAVCG